MDSAISTAARALSMADPLAALKLVALRSDPPALALRGVAMAQLAEWASAKTLLRRAAKLFGDADPVARARCVVALAEVALASRNLTESEPALDDAVALLSARGDVVNAAFARLVQVRWLTLLGENERAELELGKLSSASAPPRWGALLDLAAADLATRRGDARTAQQALTRARERARQARVLPLLSEIEAAEKQLLEPVATLVTGGEERLVRLAEVTALRESPALLVDGCRREVCLGSRCVSLVKRPVLLELLLALAEIAPREVPRDELIARAFGARRINDSHRVRLRVELGRLRKVIFSFAEIRAAHDGYVLGVRGARSCVVLRPPIAGEASALLSLLRSGDAWATSALAAAVGKSQRSVQRALVALESEGKVRARGRGRARRWVRAPSGFATSLLLVAPGTLS